MTTAVRPDLGRDFRRLWTAASVNALGDGVNLAAGPLLVASRTDSPVLVAGAAFVLSLPWLLFSLPFGAYVDRLDRLRLVVGVNVARGLLLVGLAVAVAADVASLPVLFVALFLLGVGDTLDRIAASALLPSLVGADDLPAANSRLFASQTLGGQLVGPPLGAALFVLAQSVPFGVDAVTFLAAALLMSRIAARPVRPEPTGAALRHEVLEGVRWLWRHRVLRLVALCICVMNLTFGGTLAVYVLYAREQLGLDARGYGLLLTASAVGGLAGTRLAAPLQRRWGDGVLLRAGLLVEAVTQLVLGLTHTPWVAGLVMVGFGVHNTVWGVVTVSLRQRAVTEELRGRITGVYFLFSAGGLALGSLAGGLVADAFGISAPYLLAAAVVALVAVCTWRAFRDT